MSCDSRSSECYGVRPHGNPDWHQKRDSQLIGRGTLDTAYRPADSVTRDLDGKRDLDGNERVLNRTIDLGCWEVQAGLGFQIILR